MRKAGITPSKVPLGIKKQLQFGIKKQLQFGYVVSSEVQESLSLIISQKRKQLVNKVLCGNVTKKSRFQSFMSRATGVSRKRLSKEICKGKPMTEQKKEPLKARRDALKKTVVEFLLREDNSRIQPGKKDCKKVSVDGEKPEKVQCRILNDYMGNFGVIY